jgi:hypothetical protein
VFLNIYSFLFFIKYTTYYAIKDQICHGKEKRTLFHEIILNHFKLKKKIIKKIIKKWGSECPHLFNFGMMRELNTELDNL